MPKVDQSGMVHRGPVKDRSCTDILCLIIFLAFLFGWGVIGFYGFTLGDPQRLLHPTDSNGRICGVDEGLKNKTNLFFFDLTRCANPSVLVAGCPTPQVCVEACPNETFIAEVLALQIGDPATKKKLICKDNVTVSQYTVKQLVERGDCARWYIQSSPVAGRCLPAVGQQKDPLGVFKEAGAKSMLGFGNDEMIEKRSRIMTEIMETSKTFQRIFQDYTKTWWIILIGLVLSMCISFIWIVLMRFVAGLMVWLSIFAVLALQGVGCWYCFTRYTELKNFPVTNQTLAQIAFTTKFESYLGLSETWMAFLVILGISMITLILMLIFLRNRIRIAIALIGHASNAVGDLMSTLIFPIFPWIFQVLVIGYFCAVALYAASIGKSTFKVVDPMNQTTNCSCSSVIDSEGTCIPLGFEQICGSKCPGAVCQFFQYGGTNYVTVLQAYNLFGLFWGLFFVSAMAEMVLAGAFSSWYWTFNKPRDVPAYALTTSLFRTLFYHLGTVAFGSLVIAIIRSIRVILEYIDRKVREYADNCCSRVTLCLCKCCFWMLEKFMRFVNRNAYVVCAISGTNFCTSAGEAFSLLLRNVVRVAVLDKVTDLLLFVGRLVIVSAIGLASFFVFTGQVSYVNDYLPPTNYYLVPVITTTLGAFFISGLFFSVYSMAIDTIFVCFLQDSEQNDGSPEKPFYMSQGLMEILGKKNKI